MKVFLSWSGERSKAMAYLLDDWLQSVIQALQPWMSERDIQRGALWFNEISDNLQVTAGILCLTAENKDKPWILFEAGSLARGLSSQRVIPLLIDLEKKDVEPPLSQFNLTTPEEQDMWSLVQTLNYQLGERALSEGRLEKAFADQWPNFKSRYAELLEAHPPITNPAPRREEDKLDELLGLMRGMDRRLRAVEGVSADHGSSKFTISKNIEQIVFPDARDWALSQLRSGRSADDVAVSLKGFGHSMKFAIDTTKAALQEMKFQEGRTRPDNPDADTPP